MVIVQKKKKKQLCLSVDLLNDYMHFLQDYKLRVINLTLPIVVYTSESARLIMALKRNNLFGVTKGLGV